VRRNRVRVAVGREREYPGIDALEVLSDRFVGHPDRVDVLDVLHAGTNARNQHEERGRVFVLRADSG